MKTNENATMKWFIAAGGVLLFIAGLVATISMTIGTVEILLPGNVLMKLLAPVFFDIGVVVWAGMAIWGSRSTEQHAISLLAAFVDFIGMSMMILGSFYLRGGNLADVPENLGGILIGVTTFVIMTNIAAFLYFEAHSPDSIKERVEQVAENEKFVNSMRYRRELYTTAMSQVRAQLDRDGYTMAQIISKRMIVALKHEMNLRLTPAEIKILDAEVVDVDAEDTSPLYLPSPKKPNPLLASIVNFFGRRGQESIDSNTSQSSPSSDQNEPSI